MKTRKKSLLDLSSLETGPPGPPPPAPTPTAQAPSTAMAEAFQSEGGALTRELWSQFMHTFGGNYTEFENLITLRESGVIDEDEFVAMVSALPGEMTATN